MPRSTTPAIDPITGPFYEARDAYLDRRRRLEAISAAIDDAQRAAAEAEAEAADVRHQRESAMAENELGAAAGYSRQLRDLEQQAADMHQSATDAGLGHQHEAEECRRLREMARREQHRARAAWLRQFLADGRNALLAAAENAGIDLPALVAAARELAAAEVDASGLFEGTEPDALPPGLRREREYRITDAALGALTHADTQAQAPTGPDLSLPAPLPAERGPFSMARLHKIRTERAAAEAEADAA